MGPTKIVRGLTTHNTQGETKRAVFVQLQEEAANGRSHCCTQLHNGGFREDRDRLFLEMHSERIKGSRHKLQQGEL